jgi:hypothetical protein
MRRTCFASAVLTLAFVLASCAGTQYLRNWAVNGEKLKDTLRVSEGNFRLERLGSEGTSIFEGKLDDGGDRWMFEIEAWKPANASVNRFDPPIKYLYRVKKHHEGVSFLELIEVRGVSTFQFIQKGEFVLR